MSRDPSQSSAASTASTNPSKALSPEAAETTGRDDAPKPREIGGRDGPEPTRFGDWEKNGRCIDF